jgi:hypothetical protein
MKKLPPLRKELRVAIHVRAEELVNVVTQAERNGVSSNVIERHLNEELEALGAQLRTISPWTAKALLGELMRAYDLLRRASLG